MSNFQMSPARLETLPGQSVLVSETRPFSRPAAHATASVRRTTRACRPIQKIDANSREHAQNRARSFTPTGAIFRESRSEGTAMFAHTEEPSVPDVLARIDHPDNQRRNVKGERDF